MEEAAGCLQWRRAEHPGYLSITGRVPRVAKWKSGWTALKGRPLPASLYRLHVETRLFRRRFILWKEGTICTLFSGMLPSINDKRSASYTESLRSEGRREVKECVSKCN